MEYSPSIAVSITRPKSKEPHGKKSKKPLIRKRVKRSISKSKPRLINSPLGRNLLAEMEVESIGKIIRKKLKSPQRKSHASVSLNKVSAKFMTKLRNEVCKSNRSNVYSGQRSHTESVYSNSKLSYFKQSSPLCQHRKHLSNMFIRKYN